MTPFILLFAAAAVGVEAGWEPLAEGGHEYTIQIEPSLLGRLQSGNDLQSEIPPQVNVKRFRITIGTGALARIDGPPGPPPPAPANDATDNAIAAPRERPGTSDAPGDAKRGPAVPAEFRANVGEAEPLNDQASKTDEPQPRTADKPRLDSSPPVDANQPWLPFLVAAALLACSLGANLYLGWIAWDARSRYRAVLARPRAAPSA
jgi:hypothetical protein